MPGYRVDTGCVSEGRDRLAAARIRAAAAKARELDTHRRAIELHERSALYQDGLGHHAAAELERERAEMVRERLAQAIREGDG
jgi:multidrug efflux pump subunit AcrA (membrane-fusion protein)